MRHPQLWGTSITVDSHAACKWMLNLASRVYRERRLEALEQYFPARIGCPAYPSSITVQIYLGEEICVVVFLIR